MHFSFKKQLLNFFILFISAFPVQAQVFTPIVANYECGQFPNGAQFLVRKTTNGFELVRTSEVKNIYKKERRIITQRVKTINDVLKGFEQSRITKKQLIKAANKLAKFLGLEALEQDIPLSVAEVEILNFKQKLLDRGAILKTIGELIDDCESGINPKQGRGTPISVGIVPISLASSNTIYGGFLIHSSKLKNEFSTKPTGYNVCLKLVYPDGSVGRLYTGFGDDEVCGTGTNKFEGVPQSTCDALMPLKQVGYVIQKRTYAFTSLPDATTEQLLENMRLEVLQDRPMVGVMAFTSNTSRDSQVKACEAF